MIPRAPLLWLLATLAFASLIIAVVPAVAVYWLGAVAIAAILLLMDAALAFTVTLPQLERIAPGSMSLGNWSRVSISVRNSTKRTLHVSLYDHHPATFASRKLPLEVCLPAGKFATADYEVCPGQRGAFEFPGCDLRIASPLKCWARRRFVRLRSTMRVYPNYSSISKLLAFEVANNMQVAGLRLSRRRGEGIEFHQLRDYRDGDGLRSIDWKATSRMGRLISREYQDERDQQVVFVLDSGRRMMARDAELSHFDHALNAMLLLSFVALRHGDATGAMTVGEARSWLPPSKGTKAINELLNHVYDVQPAPIEIDYVAAATDLAVRQRKRSLIIFLTNVREEDSTDLQTAADLLRRRHVVILASLRERALDDALNADIHNFDGALQYAATNQYLDARREAHKLMRARGVFVEDCLSDELPAAITNRYLAIKRAGIL